MSQFLQALEASTAQLYITFESYQSQAVTLKQGIQVDDTQALLDTPLDMLTVSQLTPLIRELSIYADADQVLRRFLPRIMELSIDGYDRWSISLEQVFQPLARYDWRTWNTQEVVAIETFLEDVWHYHLHEISPNGTSSSADTILEAIGQVTDLEPFLSSWLHMTDTYPLAHIARMVVYGKKHRRAVRQWLTQPVILQRIEAAFWDCQDSDNAAVFSKAAEYLRLGDDTLVPA